MSIKHLMMFQCDNCNYTSSAPVHKEDELVQAPPGWWFGYSLRHDKIAVYCSASSCMPAKLLTKAP